MFDLSSKKENRMGMRSPVQVYMENIPFCPNANRELSGDVGSRLRHSARLGKAGHVPLSAWNKLVVGQGVDRK
jgi:hypothetical protein